MNQKMQQTQKPKCSWFVFKEKVSNKVENVHEKEAS